MRRKEKKKIFDINNINKKTLNIIGVILSIIIIIIVTVYYSLNMNREYINGDKKLPFLIEKNTIITVLDGKRKTLENDKENEMLEIGIIDDIYIDSEWQSFIKFNILAPHLNLAGKSVADVGCNNGYYMFKMLEYGPKSITGFDPSVHTYLQFAFLNKFIRSNIAYELLGVKNLPEFGVKFDTIFCLGVIYHRSDPIKMLKELKMALNPGGELFLDTMYIDMDGDFALSPKDRYSKIPNIYFVPTLSALQNWCERAKFRDFTLLDTKATDLQAYSFKAPRARTGHEDFRYSPQYIEI